MRVENLGLSTVRMLSYGQSIILLIQTHLIWMTVPFTMISWILGLHYWIFGNNAEVLESLAGLMVVLLVTFALLFLFVERDPVPGLKRRRVLQLMFCLSIWIVGSFLTLTSIEPGSLIYDMLSGTGTEFHTPLSVLGWVIVNFHQMLFFWAILGNILLGFKAERWFYFRENGNTTHSDSQANLATPK